MTASERDLLHWIDDPATGRALHVAAAADWQRHACEDVARLVVRASNGLRGSGVRRNDVTAMVLPDVLELTAALFGSMLAGATPCVLAPPRAFQDVATYRDHFLHAIGTIAPRLIVTTNEMVPALSQMTGPAVRICRIDELLTADGSGNAAMGPARADRALIQFTAGSSGQIRAVGLPYEALQANVAAIYRWLDWSDCDSAAFWLPQYHDMGLIGGLIAPLARGCDLWLMTPEQFVRRPLEYLRCFAERGARLTATPAFGLDHITRRIGPDDLRGMDFSGVKGFVIGAELVDPATLARFRDLLEPFGLPSGSLLPAYGLAEATLAVTGVEPGAPWTVRSPVSGGAAVVGCGSPLGDVEVAILDENRRPLPEGHVGEIVIRGRSLAPGYLRAQESDSVTSFGNAELFSGDAGFRVGTEIFPLGRLGDSIKIRGRTLFAELLEGELNKLGHPREHNAVLLGVRAGRPAVVWIAERGASSASREALDLLFRLAEGADVAFIQAAKRSISRTSSGKPRRRVLWHAFVSGRIDGNITVYTGHET